jgi:glutathione peroxidase
MNRSRRQLFAVMAGAFAAPAIARAQSSRVPLGGPSTDAQSSSTPAGGMTRVTAYAFSFAGLQGGTILLSGFAGKPMLVVNTASLCGYTPQFTGLQQLWSRYHDRGLTVIGVPSNDFGAQEPGTPIEIMATAHDEYGVTFPMAAKTEVKGRNAHPFYKWAAVERPVETPHWNFHKYLIGRDGHVAAVFPTEIEPMDARVIDAVVKELNRVE